MSPSVPVSFDKAKSFRGNGARTRLHRRALGCDRLLLVAWKAPAGVLGNEAMLVASEAQLSARVRGSRLSRLGALIASFQKDKGGRMSSILRLRFSGPDSPFLPVDAS
jgi:hypothetical protein